MYLYIRPRRGGRNNNDSTNRFSLFHSFFFFNREFRHPLYVCVCARATTRRRIIFVIIYILHFTIGVFKLRNSNTTASALRARTHIKRTLAHTGERCNSYGRECVNAHTHTYTILCCAFYNDIKYYICICVRFGLQAAQQRHNIDHCARSDVGRRGAKTIKVNDSIVFRTRRVNNTVQQ